MHYKSVRGEKNTKFKHSWVTLAVQTVMISVTVIEAMNSQHAPGQNLPSCRLCFFSSLFALIEVVASSHDSARADNKPTTDTSDCYYKVRNCIWQFLNKCIQYS